MEVRLQVFQSSPTVALYRKEEQSEWVEHSSIVAYRRLVRAVQDDRFSGLSAQPVAGHVPSFGGNDPD